MSYSISVSGATKAEAKQKVVEAIEAVVASQKPHAADKDAAVAAASAFVDLINDPADGHEIHVNMHGSLSWDHHDPKLFNNASIGISASLRKLPAA